VTQANGEPVSQTRRTRAQDEMTRKGPYKKDKGKKGFTGRELGKALLRPEDATRLNARREQAIVR